RRPGHRACPSETRAALLSGPPAWRAGGHVQTVQLHPSPDVLRTHRFVVARRKLLALCICLPLSRARAMKGPTPKVIWVFSSAQNAGFHLVTRSHHASIHTLDEVCCLQRSSRNIRRFGSMPITTCAVKSPPLDVTA